MFVNGVSCCFWIFLLGLRLGSFVAPARLGWLIGQLADELPRHDHGGGPQQHGLVMLGEPLVVADQTPVPVQPTETTFHDPRRGSTTNPRRLSLRLTMVTVRASAAAAQGPAARRTRRRPTPA